MIGRNHASIFDEIHKVIHAQEVRTREINAGVNQETRWKQKLSHKRNWDQHNDDRIVISDDEFYEPFHDQIP